MRLAVCAAALALALCGCATRSPEPEFPSQLCINLVEPASILYRTECKLSTNQGGQTTTLETVVDARYEFTPADDVKLGVYIVPTDVSIKVLEGGWRPPKEELDRLIRGLEVRGTIRTDGITSWAQIQTAQRDALAIIALSPAWIYGGLIGFCYPQENEVVWETLADLDYVHTLLRGGSSTTFGDRKIQYELLDAGSRERPSRLRATLQASGTLIEGAKRQESDPTVVFEAVWEGTVDRTTGLPIDVSLRETVTIESDQESEKRTRTVRTWQL